MQRKVRMKRMRNCSQQLVANDWFTPASSYSDNQQHMHVQHHHHTHTHTHTHSLPACRPACRPADCLNHRPDALLAIFPSFQWLRRSPGFTSHLTHNWSHSVGLLALNKAFLVCFIHKMSVPFTKLTDDDALDYMARWNLLPRWFLWNILLTTDLQRPQHLVPAAVNTSTNWTSKWQQLHTITNQSLTICHKIVLQCPKHFACSFSMSYYQLEYLAVYGRTSMAAFCQLSTPGQKFDPESLHEPI